MAGGGILIRYFFQTLFSPLYFRYLHWNSLRISEMPKINISHFPFVECNIRMHGNKMTVEWVNGVMAMATIKIKLEM